MQKLYEEIQVVQQFLKMYTQLEQFVLVDERETQKCRYVIFSDTAVCFLKYLK